MAHHAYTQLTMASMAIPYGQSTTPPLIKQQQPPPPKFLKSPSTAQVTKITPTKIQVRFLSMNLMFVSHFHRYIQITSP